MVDEMEYVHCEIGVVILYDSQLQGVERKWFGF